MRYQMRNRRQEVLPAFLLLQLPSSTYRIYEVTMNTIDFRSDTVTLPTPAMRGAIFRAELGDDVYHEDPTANRLQRMAADMLGKEDALFVASGTMANLVAVLTHCESDDRILLGSEAHMHYYESEGIIRLAGVEVRTLPNDPQGRIDPATLEQMLWESEGPLIDLVCLENTHMRCGGVPISAAYTAKIASIAHGRGVALHLDGARIFNAAIALGVSAASLVEDVDSVMFCLSKGLCCPVGSIVCGSAEFISLARQSRKLVGGGMRQAGVLAAAGIVALESMINRLADDHANAKLLAEGLAELPCITLDPMAVQTNIVIFDVEGGAPPFLAAIAEKGILALPVGPERVRMITHNDVSREDVERALETIRQVLRQTNGADAAG
jgi:threonine aldolase